ncbi:MAG TPA: sugar ABC transporter ATP-binding protein [Erysipelothrix sp.]|jgi:methyl-galactoside transport system ATP-binding protein|nr:sugar ABC transporter ATP-binding protein [Erysipelothrix sp.]
MSEYILEMKDIEKSFPGVKALDYAQLKVRPGTVHALMGENGAGKSTLMKVLFGIYAEDGGVIEYNGEIVSFKNAKEAMDKGITMIHQELQPIPMMTIAENIFLGKYPRTSLGFVDHKKMEKETEKYLKRVGLEQSPKTLLNELTVSQMQSVEIAKAISQDAKVVIMDEPSSSLTSSEVEKLFTIINNLRDEGVAVIYISHKMDEILRISDEVTILRDGQYIGTWSASELTTDKIITNMVGRELKSLFPPRENHVIDEVVLKIENFTSPNRLSFKDCSFELKRGEILAVGGLVGAQRTELMEAVYGIRATVSGQITVEGKEVKIDRPQDAIKNNIALLTEDRRGSGIFGVLSVADNTAIASVNQYSNKAGLLNHRSIHKVVDQSINALSIKTPSQKTPISSLSGGNQQKVIIARWLASNPDILILDEPTRGIDVGAKYEIYQIIGDLVKAGKSVIMVTSEMAELIGFSDRIMVMCEGRISGFLDPKNTTQEEVMALATKFM